MERPTEAPVCKHSSHQLAISLSNTRTTTNANNTFLRMENMIAHSGCGCKTRFDELGAMVRLSLGTVRATPRALVPEPALIEHLLYVQNERTLYDEFYVKFAYYSCLLAVNADFLMRGISAESSLVKAKHFRPRSFSDAPMR